MEGKGVLLSIVISVLLTSVVWNTSLCTPTYSHSSGLQSFTLADSEGPTYDLSPMVPNDRAYDLVDGSYNVSVYFEVIVNDNDPITSVSAFYKNRSDSHWFEIEMTENSSVSYTGFKFSVHAFDYVLDANHTLAVWDIFFRATDSFGHTTDSEETYLTITIRDSWGEALAGLASFGLTVFIIVLVGVMVISCPVRMSRKLR
jgi:hypothetical protein